MTRGFRQLRREAAVILIGSGLALPASLAAEPPALESPARYFGMHVHHLDAMRAARQAISFGSLRLWDADVTWKDLEPARDEWHFAALDKAVDDAAGRDVEILLPLGLTPTWASARPEEASAYGPGQASEPRSIDDWRNYVSTVARRYRHRIRHYEIWNEPNQGGFFSGSPAKLWELTCVAYRAIKAVDPAAQVVSPAATNQQQGIGWLDDFLALGAGQCFDIVGFHFYTLAHESPEAMIPLFTALKSTLRRHALEDRPIWNTEAGWFIANARVPLRTRWHVVPATAASAYVIRALVIGRSEGAQRFYWYAWDDSELGLSEPDTGQPKPAARAFSTAAAWLATAADVSCTRVDGAIFLCAIREADGATDYIAWSVRDGARLGILPQWRIGSVRQMDGGALAAVPPWLSLGEDPVLLVAQRAHP